MKKFAFLLFSIFSLVNAYSQSTIDSGTYRYSAKGDEYYYHFNGDSLLTVTHKGDTSQIIFYTDTSKTPNHIDMKILDHEGNYIYTSLGIFESAGRGRYRIRMSSDMINRPKTFMPYGNPEVVILVKLR